MKKYMRIISIILVMILCCSCSAKSAIDEIGTSADHQAQNENSIDLGEVIKQMKEEQTQSPSPSPSPTQEPVAEVNPDDIVLPEHEQVITDDDQIEPQGKNLQLVFLGDSIFDNNRDGTGIPYLTSVQCDADVYNLAIGGTRATIKSTDSAADENWDSRSLLGVVKAMRKQIPTDIFEGTRTKEILDNPNIDFSKTDYFIIEYGINDYFEGAPRSCDNETNNIYTYAGALRVAITLLRDIAPDCTIVLCPPHYCLFYNGTRLVGDSNMCDKGAGTLRDYMGTCEYIAGEQQTLFLNTYYDLGIDSYTADWYLEDGVHLTAEGRQIYADALAKLILSNEETKNN